MSTTKEHITDEAKAEIEKQGFVFGTCATAFHGDGSTHFRFTFSKDNKRYATGLEVHLDAVDKEAMKVFPSIVRDAITSKEEVHERN